MSSLTEQASEKEKVRYSLTTSISRGLQKLKAGISQLKNWKKLLGKSGKG